MGFDPRWRCIFYSISFVTYKGFTDNSVRAHKLFPYWYKDMWPYRQCQYYRMADSKPTWSRLRYHFPVSVIDVGVVRGANGSCTRISSHGRIKVSKLRNLWRGRDLLFLNQIWYGYRGPARLQRANVVNILFLIKKSCIDLYQPCSPLSLFCLFHLYMQ